MDLLEISGMDQSFGLDATGCACMCSEGSSSSQQTGDYYGVCGCSCEGGPGNFNANLSTAEQK